MTDISATLEQIEKEKKRLQPTPPVGMPIVWYQAGDRREPRAAQVTGIEGIGRISVVIFSKNSPESHKGGVLYTHHPDCEDDAGNSRTTPQMARMGTWDYVPGMPSSIPREHFQTHRESLESREKSALAQQKAEEDSRQAIEQKRSGKKEPVGA